MSIIIILFIIPNFFLYFFDLYIYTQSNPIYFLEKIVYQEGLLFLYLKT